jgi:hypothetical protein
MGNNPCCCAQKDDDPKIEVKIKDVYCCDNIQSSCCIRIDKKKHHTHHKHHTNHTHHNNP